MDPLEHIYSSKDVGLALIILLVSAKLSIWVAGRIWSLLHMRSRPKSTGVAEPKPLVEPMSSAECPLIESLPTFDWRNAEPLRLRPFSPKYHMTMALENTTSSDLIMMDNTYLDRINLRKRLIETDQEEVIQPGSTSAHPAIDELYCWLVCTYLPSRYPTMFELLLLSGETEKSEDRLIMRSLVIGEDYPTEPPSNRTAALKLLGTLVDEDFLILLPAHDADGYTLGAFVCCWPNGFHLRKMVGWRVRDIHGPVPRYEEKLQKSMDRYFTSIPVGKYVKRANWSISTNPTLHNPSGAGTKRRPTTANDFSNCHLRCERQTLHRLPRSKALIFAFHTYMTPLSEIRDEESGRMAEDLVAAIDGLTKGSVPEMYDYKGVAIWGEGVKRLLSRGGMGKCAREHRG